MTSKSPTLRRVVDAVGATLKTRWRSILKRLGARTPGIAPRERSFNYSSVGATRPGTAEQIRLPASRVSEKRVTVGRGQQRWEHAWKETLSWGIQRRAGYSILPLDREPMRRGQDLFPTANNATPPPLHAGLGVRLRTRFGPLPVAMPVRVVYVIDEPNRKGFAFGTLAGHPVSGEVAFLVERRPDNSVWFTLRSFSGPGKGLWTLVYPIVLLLRGQFKDTYLTALSGPLS